MDSKGDVRQFFWLVFRKPLARILLLCEAFASGFPRPDFEMISERVQTSVYLAIVFFGGLEKKDFFFMDSKDDVRHFFWLVFRKPLARILLLFEAFASGFPRPDFEMIPERVQTSIYLAIVFFFVYVFLFFFGGLEKKDFFLWIPKMTFGTFSGLCFASLWHESCCCVRLSQAVFQGQISR